MSDTCPTCGLGFDECPGDCEVETSEDGCPDCGRDTVYVNDEDIEECSWCLWRSM